MKFKNVKILLLTILFLIIGITVSNAGYSATNPTGTSEEMVSITVTSSTSLEAYNLDLKNNGGLGFQGCSKSEQGAIININGSSIGYINQSGSTKTLGTYKFKLPKVTEKKTYTVIFTVDQDTEVKATVTVNPKATNDNTNASTDTNTNNSNNNNNNSNNNNNNNSSTNNDSGTATIPEKAKLTSLTINGTTYKKYLKTSLEIKVEGLEYITFVPKTSDSSSCTVTNKHTKDTKTVGNGKTARIKLQEGINKITVKGKFDEVYTISVTNKAKNEEVPGNVIQEENKVLLKSLAVKGINSKEEKIDLQLTPEFSAEVYEYNITIPEEQNDVTNLNIEAIPIAEEFIVQINGNKDFVDGENVVNILVKSKDGTAVTTYKLIVNKEPKKEAETVATSVPVIEETPMEVTKTINMPRLLIVIFTAIIAIAGIVFAVMEYNYHRNKTEDREVKIPFASVGYESEETSKEDILEEIREEEPKQDKNKEVLANNDEEFEQLEEEPKTRKKGKHF